MANDPPEDDDPSGPDAAARKAADRKARKALRRLERAIRSAETEGEGLSDWEAEFAQSVKERLETYGSAFNDPEKGNRDEALSILQAQKVREIANKAKKKPGGKWPQRPAPNRPGATAKEEDNDPAGASSNPASARPNGFFCGTPFMLQSMGSEPPQRPSGPPKLTVIKGGKAD
jgi:hypothetical protein